MRPLKDRRVAPRKSPATLPSSTRPGRVCKGTSREEAQKNGVPQLYPSPLCFESYKLFSSPFVVRRGAALHCMRIEEKPPTLDWFPGQLPFIHSLKHKISLLRMQCVTLKPHKKDVFTHIQEEKKCLSTDVLVCFTIEKRKEGRIKWSLGAGMLWEPK